ncbi:MAG: DsbA family oxidoreductase [Thermoplasmata archaeon]
MGARVLGNSVQVEVWMDVVCPWCYIGRRRFERAVHESSHRDDVEIVYRSFELEPEAPPEARPLVADALTEKYGISRAEAEEANARVTEIAQQEGLEFHLERALRTNTLDAHRLLQLAGIRRIRPAVEERFQRAYFTEGEDLYDPVALLRLSTEAGLKESDARRVLAGQAFTLQVRKDEQEARSLGAEGVPFFVFDRRETISGAQPTESFRRALSAMPP